MKRAICHDCGVKEGQIHKVGCDMERCPFCGGQLITCQCCYTLLHINCAPGTHVYEHGLRDDQWEKWIDILLAKGRIPWIQYPNICGKCGKLWPDFFSVPNEEWQKYIALDEQNQVICRPCYDQIKKWIDNAKPTS